MQAKTSVKNRAASPARAGRRLRNGPARCRRTFLRIFPGGFYDATYVDWERDYKWDAHRAWRVVLGRARFAKLLLQGAYSEIAQDAVRIESRTNLLFSFEKMALRDAVRSEDGARRFAEGLFAFLYGRGGASTRFDRWCDAVAELPRRQTRVLTWPIVTVFGFIAQPDRHIFLKPNVTRRAAQEYGFEFTYESRPSWATYESYLAFAEQVRRYTHDLHPRDMIDVQSFIWVMGSDEYD